MMDPQVPRTRSGRSTCSGSFWSSAPTRSFWSRSSPVPQTHHQAFPFLARTRCEGTGRRQSGTAALRSPRRRNLLRFLYPARLALVEPKIRRWILRSCLGNGHAIQHLEGSLIAHCSAIRALPPRLDPTTQLWNPTVAFGIRQRHRNHTRELEITSPAALRTKQC